jgi:signal transduction histidine kinase
MGSPSQVEEINVLIAQLKEKGALLKEKEQDLEDQQEEFLSQHEELNTAIEELIAKNRYLTLTLEKLKRRSDELDQVLYRASHDLKTPVTSIFGLIQILQQQLLTNDQQQILTHLLGKTKQMDTLLTSLTELSIAFFNPVQIARCSPLGLIEQGWRNVVSENMQLNVSGDVQEFESDPALLKVLFHCILDNATIYRDKVKYGSVTVNLELIDESLSIEIINDGDEIPLEVAGRIFEMFYRGSEKSRGAGLGLYIAKSIVAKLQGTIEYSGARGNTMFTVILPRFIPESDL